MTNSIRHNPITGMCSNSDRTWKNINHTSYRSRSKSILSKLFKNDFDDSNISFPTIEETSDVFYSNKDGKVYHGLERHNSDWDYKRMMRK